MPSGGTRDAFSWTTIDCCLATERIAAVVERSYRSMLMAVYYLLSEAA
jgi:hypothetical protein